MTSVDASAGVCRLLFTSDSTAPLRTSGPAGLHVAVPLLAGAPADVLLSGAGQPECVDDFTLFRAGTQLSGYWRSAPGTDLEASTRQAYRHMLGLLGEHRLYRVWNFVPRINVVEQGLENYRRFCRGRSLAFEEHFGAEFSRQLAAASAVGSGGDSLALAFLAGRKAPTHFENPAQVPAFEYPAQYGPRPPSFARATAVQAVDGRDHIFISGTAAIRDHRTVGAGELDPQLACTLENLRLIGAAAGAGDALGAQGWQRTFKIYLRRASDLAATQARLERELLRPTDTTQYLQADICRAELLVEIEATLTR